LKILTSVTPVQSNEELIRLVLSRVREDRVRMLLSRVLHEELIRLVDTLCSLQDVIASKLHDVAMIHFNRKE
jgi:hypothetical protein